MKSKKILRIQYKLEADKLFVDVEPIKEGQIAKITFFFKDSRYLRPRGNQCWRINTC